MSAQEELAPAFSELGKIERGGGKGAALFVRQGAGIEADAASEIAKFLHGRGWKVLSGRWEEGSMRSGIDSAFGELLEPHTRSSEPPTVISAYAFTEDGLCHGKFEAKEAEVDADIFTGMFTAVQNFIKDSMKKEGKGLESAGIGGRLLLSESTEHFGIVLVVEGAETSSMRFDLDALAQRIEKQYGKIHLTGDESQVRGLEEMLAGAINERKYREEFIDQTRTARIHAWRRALSRLEESSSETPVAVVLDNAHLADSTATSFLYDFAKAAAEQNILLVVIHEAGELEEAEANPALEGTIGELLKEGLCSRVELKGKLQKALAPKLGEVSETDLRILSAAALSGPEIEVPVVVGASGAPPEEVKAALLRFEKAGFVRGGRMRSGKVSEEIISRTENVSEISLRAAAAIEALHPADLASHCERLARLYCAAAATSEKARRKAVAYSLMSASAALAATQNRIALGHYDRALALSDDNQAKMGMLESIILLEKTMGMPERLAHCDRLEELANAAGDRRRVAMAYMERAFVHMQGNETAKVEAQLESALLNYEQAKDLEGMAYTYTSMANVRANLGEYEKALANLDRAMECAERCGSQRQIANAKSALANTHEWMGNFEASQKYREAALDIFQRLGDKRAVSVTLNSVMSHYFSVAASAKKGGDEGRMRDAFAKLLETGGKCVEVSLEIGNMNSLANASASMAGAHLEFGGSLDDAERLSKEALAYGKRAANFSYIAAALTNLKDVYGRRYRESDRQARELLPRFRDSDIGRRMVEELDRLDREMGGNLRPECNPRSEFNKHFCAAELQPAAAGTNGGEKKKTRVA